MKRERGTLLEGQQVAQSQNYTVNILRQYVPLLLLLAPSV